MVSAAAGRIALEALKSDVTIESLAKLAHADAAFAMKLLALVNSPAFARSRTVSDINQAASLLGIRGLRTVALSLVVSSLCPEHESCRLLMANSLRRAVACRLVATEVACKDLDTAFATGLVMLVAEWDWIAAERSFQRALAINSNHAEAHLHYGTLMEALGDLERGFQVKLQGLECDSTSALAHVWIAVSFWNQRRYDDVIVWANKALDRDPQHPFAFELLAGAYRKMGDLEHFREQGWCASARAGGCRMLVLGRRKFQRVALTPAAHAHAHAPCAEYRLKQSRLPPARTSAQRAKGFSPSMRAGSRAADR